MGCCERALGCNSGHAGVRALGDVEREDGDVVAVEGTRQREQFEEQHAQRPRVGGLAVRLGLDQLGREVERPAGELELRRISVFGRASCGLDYDYGN